MRQTLALVLCLGLSLSALEGLIAQETANDNAVTLTIAEVRALALQAQRDNRPDLVLRLAYGLLKADPKDDLAHFLIADAYARTGRPAQGRRAAARAYRFAPNDLRRFQAAELAARLSYGDKRPTLTQLWLRRAVQNAPNAQIEEKLGQDYARVRRENPLSFSLRGGLRRSSNINNGADTALQVIDGVPVTGTLSGDAQALSGIIANADLSLSYRLRGTARSATHVSGRIYVQRVDLSDSAKALSPTSRNRDFGFTYGEARLSHAFAVGEKSGSARVGATLGSLWYGGDKSYDFARLDGERAWQIGGRGTLTLGAAVERRGDARNATFDREMIGLKSAYVHRFEGGNQLQLALDLLDTRSDADNARSETASMRLFYAWGKQFGPAKISAGLTLGYADYPDYTVLLPVPGGRQDRSLYGDLNIFLPDYDYAGFAPTINLRVGRKSSNVSRFDTREAVISIGIGSKF